MHMAGTLMTSLVFSSVVRNLLKLEIPTMNSPKAFFNYYFNYSESDEKHLYHKPNFYKCVLGIKKKKKPELEHAEERQTSLQCVASVCSSPL